MHDPLIEDYLLSLGKPLRSLPKERYEEEVNEIRQHLEALKAAFLAQGYTQREAAEAALSQFGHAGKIGTALLESKEGPRRLLKAVSVYVLSVAVIYAFFATANDKPTDFPYTFESKLLLSFVLPIGVLIHALLGRNLRLPALGGEKT